MDEYGASYPSVTVYYSARPNNTGNMSTCNPEVWDDFIDKPDKPEDLVQELDIILTLVIQLITSHEYN